MKEQNPNAFPCDFNNEYYQRGMTLRDYFAAKAMNGLISMENKEEFSSQFDCWKKMSEYSYQLADAMLKERNK